MRKEGGKKRAYHECEVQSGPIRPSVQPSLEGGDNEGPITNTASRKQEFYPPGE